MSILVLISGSGTNLQALIDAKLPVKHVISSSADAYGLERAHKAEIPTTVHSLKSYYAKVSKDKEARAAARAQFNTDLAKIVLDLKPSLVVCAGWMLILAPNFLNPLKAASTPIINLHPALPGAFPGIHAIERAWQAGQDGTAEYGGLMIHYVIAEVDEGEPIVVKKLKLDKNETCEQYEARVHAAEHEAIVEGVRIALPKEIN